MRGVCEKARRRGRLGIGVDLQKSHIASSGRMPSASGGACGCVHLIDAHDMY